MNKSEDERFWEKVNKTDTCWLWTASTASKGYGQFWSASRQRKLGAHRWSYEFHFGKFPDALWVLHRCDTPRCVRPDHLFLGDNDDNVADMVSKERHSFGERNSGAKTTAVAVIQLVSDRANGMSIDALCKKYRLSTSVTYNIIMGKRWRKTVESIDPEILIKARSRHDGRVLTAKQSIEIRERYFDVGQTIKQISELYGVGPTSVGEIIRCREWKSTATKRDLRNASRLPDGAAKGVRHGASKLSAKEIVRMRELFSQGESVYRIAKLFETNWGSANAIVRRRSYKDVQ